MNIDFDRYMNNIIKILKSTQIIISLNVLISIGFTFYISTIIKEEYSFVEPIKLVIIIISVFLGVILFLRFSSTIKQFRWILSHYQTDKETCIQLLNEYKGKLKSETFSKYSASLNKAYEILTTS